MEIVRELCSFEGRLAGTDAERRAANRLAERLRGLGRRAEIEPTYVHPQIGLIFAAHAALGFAGSLVSVAIPALGFGLVLLAATSLYLDLNARFYLLRRLFFRRASQNVVSKGADPGAPARLVITAHYDAARTGAAFGPGPTRLMTRIQHAFPFPISPSRILFWSLALLVPVVGARMAGIESDPISLAQLPPTLVLLVGIFASVDIALSEVVPGANDNGSGVATAVSLAATLGESPAASLDVWVVLTGGEECLMEGMRSFVRSHRDDLDPASTFVLNLDSVGRGDVRFEVSEGPAVSYELGSRLTELAGAIAEADAGGENRFRATALRHGFATDVLPARLARIPGTTITSLEPGALVPANYHTHGDVPDALDPEAIDRAHDFALELIRRLDADVGRRVGVETKPGVAAAR
jgi:hypothetical protein